MSLGKSSTELGKVRGLGSAREGGEHWISERVSSIALLLLGTWLIASLLFLPALDYATVREWLRTPLGAVPMALFVITSFQHAIDGLAVVIDDYVHDEANRLLTRGLLLFAGYGAAALALFSLARVAFGATA